MQEMKNLDIQLYGSGSESSITEAKRNKKGKAFFFCLPEVFKYF